MSSGHLYDAGKMAAISRRLLQTLLSIISLVEAQSPYPSMASTEDVIAQSIKFGTAELGCKAPPETSISFERFLDGVILGLVVREHVAGEVQLDSLESLSNRLSEFDPYLKWRPEALAPSSTTVATLDSVLGEIVQYSQTLGSDWFKYVGSVDLFACGRRFFASHGRYVGWVPRCAEEEDLICAFDGYRYPFAIRPKGEGYELLGAVYMEGLMDGEASELPNKYGNGEEDMIITLV